MEDYLGRVVYSRKGRDQGKCMAVYEVVNEQYVLVVDGDLRRVENPKLKNIKHLKFTELVLEEIADALKRGEIPGNHLIRKNLRELNAQQALPGKEV